MPGAETVGADDRVGMDQVAGAGQRDDGDSRRLARGADRSGGFRRDAIGHRRQAGAGHVVLRRSEARTRHRAFRRLGIFLVREIARRIFVREQDRDVVIGEVRAL